MRALPITTLLTALALAACGGGGTAERAAPEPRDAPAGAAERDREERAPALRGGERVVFIGDSLALQAPPNYPQLLPAALGERAPGVETLNLAEPGSTAADWRDGSELFEGRLAPELEEADLVVVTVGGNDLEEAIGGVDGVDALSRAAGSGGAALDAIDRVGRHLRRTFAAIRTRAPGTAIAYVGYPDYASAAAWRERGGAAGTFALELGLDALFAAAAGAEPDLLIDMRAATERAGVDSLLADDEYLAPAGHELYARRLARVLTKPQPIAGEAG
jgi:lysophospholipase L1-like esterase